MQNLKQFSVRNLTLATMLLLAISFLLFGTETAQAASQNKVRTEKIAPGTKYATDLYIIESNQPGPVVMVVGGVHGNETAGYTAARKITDYKISRGTLLVLPQANRRAVNAHKRYLSSDLNRDFPVSKYDSADTILAKSILNVINKYDVDWVMDMHEGINYSRLKSSDSVGQSVIYYPSAQMTPFAKKVAKNFNKDIKTSYRKFSVYVYPVKGSLASAAAKVHGANSFILETCKKDKLSTRQKYQLEALNLLLSKLKMN